MTVLPRYPVYVVSKGRWATPYTARFLDRDNVPYRIVVEPQEAAAYTAAVGADRILELPFSNLGQGSIPARNWIWEHALQTGAERHWILDDNIRRVYRYWKGNRIPCASGPAFAVVEDFTDRYENVAISGMAYKMFGLPGAPPFWHNVHVYSCMLIKNSLGFRWRGRYNEDTDLCLQVLSAGHCTILVNAFLADKIATMQIKGGNTDELYEGDGRLKMARALERAWPHVVTVDRRWNRPQHVVNWGKFDTPLRRKPGLRIPDTPNEYGLTLKAVKPVKSQRLQRLLG
jgi:hypothetical protein